MLPSDIALKTDPIFCEFARAYSRDQELFFADFAKSFSKLMHLGCPNQPQDAPPKSSLCKINDEFLSNAMHGNIDGLINAAVLADWYSVDEAGRSALHKASFWNHHACVKYLISNVDMCGDVLINLQDSNGDTALHDAVRYGHLESIKFLCPKTNLKLKNRDGHDSIALAKLRGDARILDLLLNENVGIKSRRRVGSLLLCSFVFAFVTRIIHL